MPQEGLRLRACFTRLQHRSPQGGLQICSNLFHIPTNPHIQNSLSLGKVKFPLRDHRFLGCVYLV
jgi:hypothetical protein